MPTAIWTGSLSFGLVVVPVRLYPAVRKKRIRFHELDARGRRVRHVRVSEPDLEFDFRGSKQWPSEPDSPKRQAIDLPSDGIRPEIALPTQKSSTFDPPSREVPFQEIRKGYVVAPGQYVTLTREEVQALAPERSRVIDVQQFADVSAVDPIYFESRYYVTPDRGSASSFEVLRRAMADADRMAIAWFTLRQRRYLSAIRPFRDVMLLTTMVQSDEVLAADFWTPDIDRAPTERELKMARLLIDTLAGPFEAERYTDEHRERLFHAIEEKTPAPAAVPASAPQTRVQDLMAALEASVKAARATRAKQALTQKLSRRRSRGA
ncbi:MAG: hypothetical protein M3R21_11755 [Candidatus Dormibacteraeota bacterium]|nr:hypothetical protein [Candidatus Dormibacteraeota bacterium]